MKLSVFYFYIDVTYYVNINYLILAIPMYNTKVLFKLQNDKNKI